MESFKVKELKATAKALGVTNCNTKSDLILVLGDIELRYRINLFEYEFITRVRDVPIRNPLTRKFFREMRREIELWVGRMSG